MDKPLRNPHPHDVPIEEAVLGALVIEPHAILQVCTKLKPEMFFQPEHQEIYRAIEELHQQGNAIDILTVTEEMRRQGTLEKIGGPFALTQLSSKMASSAHLEYHAAILLDLYTRRELIRMNAQYNDTLQDFGLDTYDLIYGQREALDAIEGHYPVETLRGLSTVFTDACKQMAWRMENHKNGLTGIPTGLDELNRLTAGFQGGDLIILAGRPSMGKTAISLCMAMEAAEAGHKVLYCSIEMTAERLMDRWIIGETGIDPYRWKSGQSTPEELAKVKDAEKKFKDLPITVDDNPMMSMDYIFYKARMLNYRNQCDAVFVDYLQLGDIKPVNRNDTRQIAVGEATRKAKLMAKKLNIPVVLLSQLNRKSEEREDKRPGLAELRESGNIEQDADLVMIVHRPAQAGLAQDERSGYPAEGLGILIVAKNRNGQTGDVCFGHNESLTRIGDYSPPVNWMKENAEKKIDAKKLRGKYKK